MMQEDLLGNIQEPTIRVTAHVKPEALPFLREHGCIVEPHRSGELVLFPAGSRQEPLSHTSKRCSNILLPDGTVITAMDCHTRFVLLVFDTYCHATHLAL